MLGLWPQSVGASGTQTSCATRALVGRRAADVAENQLRHSGVGVEPGRTRQARIDDDTHAVDGEGAFGDVGGEHDSSSAGFARSQCSVLFVLAERAREWEEIDVRIDDPRRSFDCATDLPDTRQEHENVPIGFAQCTEHRVSHFVLEPVGVATLALADRRRLPPVDLDGEESAVTRNDRYPAGVGRVVIRQVGAPTFRVGCCRHEHDALVGAE